MQWGHRGIDWSEVVLSQGMLLAPEEEAKNRFSLEHPKGVWSCQHLSFSDTDIGLLASTPVRE